MRAVAWRQAAQTKSGYQRPAPQWLANRMTPAAPCVLRPLRKHSLRERASKPPYACDAVHRVAQCGRFGRERSSCEATGRRVRKIVSSCEASQRTASAKGRFSARKHTVQTLQLEWRHTRAPYVSAMTKAVKNCLIWTFSAFFSYKCDGSRVSEFQH